MVSTEKGDDFCKENLTVFTGTFDDLDSSIKTVKFS